MRGALPGTKLVGVAEGDFVKQCIEKILFARARVGAAVEHTLFSVRD